MLDVRTSILELYKSNIRQNAERFAESFSRYYKVEITKEQILQSVKSLKLDEGKPFEANLILSDSVSVSFSMAEIKGYPHFRNIEEPNVL